MKRSRYILISALALSLAMLSAAWAAETREEKTLGREAARINTTADNEKGEKVVVQKLETEFKVTDAQIQSLRDAKLGYGEIAIVFSLAQKSPGGITDASINQVMSLRNTTPPTGWGEVAKKLDVKLGATISQVKGIGKAAAGEVKGKEKGESMGREGGQHEGVHGEMGGHEGMGGGAGMPRGNGR
ncbi:MAG TPA: hypothetical protein VF903_03110 [Nitrospirota bacterium]